MQHVQMTKDGLKLTLEDASNRITQSKYNDGWMHNHSVPGAFVFHPHGTILIAYYNIWGAVHDSQVVKKGDTYDKLQQVYVISIA